MKSFEKLSPAQQVKAIERCLARLLGAVCEGEIRFNDDLNGNDLQKRIDAARSEAESMRTPWFAHEYILHACKDELEGVARADAEDALYSEPGENVVHGIA